MEIEKKIFLRQTRTGANSKNSCSQHSTTTCEYDECSLLFGFKIVFNQLKMVIDNQHTAIILVSSSHLNLSKSMHEWFLFNFRSDDFVYLALKMDDKLKFGFDKT